MTSTAVLKVVAIAAPLVGQGVIALIDKYKQDPIVEPVVVPRRFGLTRCTVFVVLSAGTAVVGALFLTEAALGVGLLIGACVLGIFARIAQAADLSLNSSNALRAPSAKGRWSWGL